MFPLIGEFQREFLRSRSCLTNLLEFMEEFGFSLDKYKLVDVVFLDFQKTIGKVLHIRILHKVKGMGIGSDLLTWIQSRLYVRK